MGSFSHRGQGLGGCIEQAQGPEQARWVQGWEEPEGSKLERLNPDMKSQEKFRVEDRSLPRGLETVRFPLETRNWKQKVRWD